MSFDDEWFFLGVESMLELYSRSRRDSRICSVSLPSASPSRSPPSFAVRCGGDFNTFVSSISAAAAAGTSQSVISQTLGQGIS
jgi:hypothetical protein